MDATHAAAAGRVDVDDSLGDLRIVDADCHFTEPPDLWTSRAPASFKDRVPRVELVNGQHSWMIGDQIWIGGAGGNVIGKGGTKTLGVLSLPRDQIDDACWKVKDRLDLMDRQGVYAEVIYPNAVGFSSNTMFGISDIEFRDTVSKIYNDYLIDMQNESGERLLPQALLPIWDMDLTVKELQRLHEAGIRGFTLTDKPHLVGLPDLDDPYFAPMWAAANEVGTVLSFHIGSGVPARPMQDKSDAPDQASTTVIAGPNPDLYWSSFGPQRRLAVLATQFYMSNARIIINLCMSDMFDRYPDVKIVSAESGIGWVPFILEAMEYQLDEMVTTPQESSLQQRRPKEYFHSNIYVMTWFEQAAWRVIDEIGVDNIMVETDVPHPTTLYPNTRQHFANVAAHLSDEDRRKVFQDNGAKIYRLNLP
jgi:predicted TIM-barrel fold metal-dependent hydrolase